MADAWQLGLIPPNARVRVEASSSTRDASGGQVFAWSTLLSSAAALISQVQGGRPGQWDAEPNQLSGLLTGFDPELGRADVRLVVTSGFLSGRTLYPEAVELHPAGTFVSARYRVRWSTVQPAT